MKGFFGNLFDFNHDGKLNAFERTADFMAFQDVMSSENDASNNSSFSSSPEVEDEEESELKSALDDAGVDEIDFELMDDDEKREVLEDAGLEPWEYDL